MLMHNIFIFTVTELVVKIFRTLAQHSEFKE